MEQIDQKLIERYFEGDLDEQELALVTQKLQADPNFAEAFQLEQDLLAGIEQAGHLGLRKRLDAIHQETVKQETPVRQMKSSRRWIWLAAAAFIGAVILGKLYFDGQAKTPQQLYAKYAVHDFDFTEKGGSETELAKAEQLLKEKKYAEALPVLEGYLRLHPDERQVLVAEGVSLMETGPLSDAFDIFDSMSNNPIMAPDMAWYKALILLKENKLDECLAMLNSVHQGAAKYKNALALAADLKKIKQ